MGKVSTTGMMRYSRWCAVVATGVRCEADYFNSYTPGDRFTNFGLRMAVKRWCEDRAVALAKYGPMAEWDVSEVTDMESLFSHKYDFNEPIGAWDTGKVTNMKAMFGSTKAFNHPIGAWNTSNVAGMNHMFVGAQAFNQPIGVWNTGKVT